MLVVTAATPKVKSDLGMENEGEVSPLSQNVGEVNPLSDSPGVGMVWEGELLCTPIFICRYQWYCPCIMQSLYHAFAYFAFARYSCQKLKETNI